MVRGEGKAFYGSPKWPGNTPSISSPLEIWFYRTILLSFRPRMTTHPSGPDTVLGPHPLPQGLIWFNILAFSNSPDLNDNDMVIYTNPVALSLIL